MIYRKRDLEKRLAQIEEGAGELRFEAANAADVLRKRGYPDVDPEPWAARKLDAATAAEQYADGLRVKLGQLTDSDRVDPVTMGQAEKVAQAAQLGGILIDGRSMALGQVGSPWATDADKEGAGIRLAEEKASTTLGSGAFVLVEEPGQVPFFQLSTQGQAAAQPTVAQTETPTDREDQVEREPAHDASAPAPPEDRAASDFPNAQEAKAIQEEFDHEDAEAARDTSTERVPTQEELSNGTAVANEDGSFSFSPTNEDFDFTTEQEERASGLPSAQAEDYSEEPLGDDQVADSGQRPIEDITGTHPAQLDDRNGSAGQDEAFSEEPLPDHPGVAEATAKWEAFDQEHATAWSTQPEQQHQTTEAATEIEPTYRVFGDGGSFEELDPGTGPAKGSLEALQRQEAARAEDDRAFAEQEASVGWKVPVLVVEQTTDNTRPDDRDQYRASEATGVETSNVAVAD